MFSVLFFNLKTSLFRLFEWFRVVVCYYRICPRFFLIDCLLGCSYFIKNPHSVSRAFLKKRREKNIYQYGETPLSTLDDIAKECQITSKDRFYELGCGSGRTCFWLYLFVKCPVVGIDFLPTFIQKADRVKRWMRLDQLKFIHDNFLDTHLQNATVIYLYGTCLEESMIERLVQNFKNIPRRTKVITVSYPLTDYSSEFILSKEFTGRFPWGSASIFLNEKT